MSETLEKARELLDDQKFEEALQLLHTVTPVDAKLKVSVARALSGLGRWEEAHSLFSEALNDDPDNHEGLAGRGLIYFLSGQLDKAQADYDKAIEAAPMNGRYQGLRGVLAAQLGDAPGALKKLEACYDLGCHEASFLLARAQLHLASRDVEKSKELIDLCSKHDADEASIAALEGAYHMLKGDPKEALASYRFCVEKAPEGANNWMNMLTLTAKLDRPRLLEEAMRALEAHPNNNEVIQVAVGAHIESGKVKEAFKLLDEAIERNPKNPALLFQKGIGLANAGKFEGAVEQFTKALEIVPRFPRALDARGNCLERLDRKEEAKADFEKSHQIRQEDAEKAAVQQQMVAQSTNGAEA